MKELVEFMAKALVDQPDQVEVRPVTKGPETQMELRVAESDLGKVIGRQGRTARSMRAVLAAAAMKARKHVSLEIIE